MPEWTVKRNAHMARVQAVLKNSPYFTVAKPSVIMCMQHINAYVQVNIARIT